MLDFCLSVLNFDSTTFAGACLWAVALYFAFAGVREWLMTQLARWFAFAERSLYASQQEFDRTRDARESQNAFYASIFSIFPFFVFGWLCDWLVEVGLGRSWAISVGILAFAACGVYDLGRRSSRSE